MAIRFGYSPHDMPLKKGFFTSEPYPPSLRARFEGEYGMKTINVYGTADAGFIGYSYEDVPGFCVSSSIFVEIVDPANGQPVPPGETGEIVVTTYDKVYPLLRFGTGDLGALAAESHPAFPGRQHLLGLYGRSGDAIKVRGMFLHPNQVNSAVSQMPEIKYAQAVVTRIGNRDHVTVRVQLKPEHAGVDVSERLKSLLQNAARLKVDDVAVVEPGVIDPAQRMVRDERQWD
jgi:phenylacetate-CoA ligase